MQVSIDTMEPTKNLYLFMERPLPNEYNPAYQKYFDLLEKGDFFEGLNQNLKDTVEFFENIPIAKHNFKYAPNKWTVKELLQHIIDTERVFAIRSLMAARRDDETPIHRMDEELYARNVVVTNRTMESLLNEFVAVRKSTQILFEHFTAEQSKLFCNIISYPMTTRAIGYFIIGHSTHHINVIKEKYL
jgi:uncharacterized damage-inducible protein DinB